MYTSSEEKTVYTMGIDVGSITTKAALMRDGLLYASKVIFTGYNVEAAAGRVYEEVISAAKITADQVRRIIATGYGRKGVSMAPAA